MVPRALFAIVLFTLAGWAQEPAPAKENQPPQDSAPAKILVAHGVVVERGSRQPIQGARIVVFDKGQNVLAETATDAAGRFRLEIPPDSTTFTIVKKGYAAALGPYSGLDEDDLKEDVTAELDRGAGIRGTAEDAETRKPVPGVRLQLALGGEYVQTQSTDSDGRFEFEVNISGRYAVRVLPEAWAASEQFDEKDLNAVDQGFEEGYWPGGGDRTHALPVQAVSGGMAEVGTILVRRVPYYRAHILLPAEGCSTGIEYHGVVLPDLRDLEGTEAEGVSFRAVCGHGVLVRGLAPGRYRVEITTAEQDAPRAPWALERFEIRGANVSVTADLVPGVDLLGRVVAAEGSGPIPKDLVMRFRDPVRAGVVRSAVVNEKGRFSVPNLALRQWLAPFFTTGWALREARLGGKPVPLRVGSGRDVSLEFSSSGDFVWDGIGELELVLDDQPGGITGTVSPAKSAAMLLVMPWNEPQGGYLTAIAEQVLDGRIEIHSLAAGDYRVVAIPVGEAFDGRPSWSEVLAKVAGAGQKVAVTRGSDARVDVNVVSGLVH